MLPDAIAAILVLAGVAGVVVPVLPGTPLIFLGALVYDWAHGWNVYGWGWLGLLFLLMLVAEVGDWLLSQVGAKQGGLPGWPCWWGACWG